MVIVGIDEVGRGCWAGPVVAAAVALDRIIAGSKDSKVLSKPVRTQLAEQIKTEALAYGIGWVDATTIDNVGINTAVKMAMEAALQHINVPYDEIIVDGHINFLAKYPKSRAIVKADGSVPAVSAASIIAKVARDDYMAEQARAYPGYGFEKHVGYGTAEHMSRLSALGVCDLHRKSYKPIKTLLAASRGAVQ